METFDIRSEERVVGGKGALRRIKSEGFVPGILYTDEDSIPISLEEHRLREVLAKNGENILVNVTHNGKTVTARIKEVQRNPVTQEIQHIDLMPVTGEGGQRGTLH
ncbi:MAG: 50S ribosomal protein L25 [Clostridia bacterium]|nr:50S ribosomal protein L25 [Clostridia bacterium]